LRVRSTTQETQQADKKEKLAPHGVEAARTKQQQLLPACSRTGPAGTNNDSAYIWMREWVSEGVSEWPWVMSAPKPTATNHVFAVNVLTTTQNRTKKAIKQ
jgi:hypothetical protein